MIADLDGFGHCKTSSVPQDKLLALRELLCFSRAYPIDVAPDLKRKLIALLDRAFRECESLFDPIFGKASVAVLRKHTPCCRKSRITSGETHIDPLEKQPFWRMEGSADEGSRIHQFWH